MEVDVLGHALMRTSNGFPHGTYESKAMEYYMGTDTVSF